MHMISPDHLWFCCWLQVFFTLPGRKFSALLEAAFMIATRSIFLRCYKSLMWTRFIKTHLFWKATLHSLDRMQNNSNAEYSWASAEGVSVLLTNHSLSANIQPWHLQLQFPIHIVIRQCFSNCALVPIWWVETWYQVGHLGSFRLLYSFC